MKDLPHMTIANKIKKALGWITKAKTKSTVEIMAMDC